MLYVAEPVLAVFAADSGVRPMPESLGVAGVCNFPAYQNNTRCEKQAPSEKARNKQHRGIHHEVTPIVNTAVYTAAVLHDY